MTIFGDKIGVVQLFLTRALYFEYFALCDRLIMEDKIKFQVFWNITVNGPGDTSKFSGHKGLFTKFTQVF